MLALADPKGVGTKGGWNLHFSETEKLRISVSKNRLLVETYSLLAIYLTINVSLLCY